MSQKSYDKSPTLYLIPTPIGNMDDITLRAVKILNEVSVVFSEDTRVTGLLLKHLNLKKKLLSSHVFNEEKNEKRLLEYFEDKQDVGLVTDRGTPVISDPGYVLARYAIQSGYNVVGLPGATALIPALIMSGIKPMPFTFYGFLDSKESQRKKELLKLKSKEETLIFYEAPHRISKTLGNILEIFGNRNISISREISKRYEEVYRGLVSEVIKEVVDVKGEIVVVVEGNTEIDSYDDLDVVTQVNLFIEEGLPVMEAIKKVSKLRGLSKGEIYSKYHNIKD